MIQHKKYQSYKIKNHLKTIQSLANVYGVVVTISGTILHFPGINHESNGYNNRDYYKSEKHKEIMV